MNRHPVATLQSLIRPDVGSPHTTGDAIVALTSAPSVVYDPWLDLSSRDRLRASLEMGVQAAIEAHTSSSAAAASTAGNIYDPSRGNWQVYCPVRRDAVILDYGCGLGALTRSLARTCGTVVGLDACYERLMVHAAVNAERGVSNVAVAFGNHESLEAFRPESFDGIVLNGVLEWVPEYISGAPREVQRAFLRSCRRILKRDGWLYVGIENRWGFRYFAGRRDDHTGLRFSNLLPRRLADVYSRSARQRPYRTYTYGRRALKALLHDAGFAAVDSYTPVPDYRHFSLLVGPSSDMRQAGVAHALGVSKPWKQRLIEAPGFIDRMAPSLAMVASPAGTHTPAWLADLAAPPNHAYVKYDQVSFWYPRDRRLWVRDLALSYEAEGKLRRITRLADGLRNAPECPAALRSLHLRGAGGFTWTDREAIEGTTLAALDAAQQEAYSSRVLESFRATHSAGVLLGTPMHIRDVVEDYASGGLERLSPDARRSLDMLLQIIESGAVGPALLMHGDSSSKNVVVADGRPELIDWEWARVVNFPAYDVLKFAWTDREDPRAARAPVQMATYFGDARARAWCAHVHPGLHWPTAVCVYWVLRTARALSRFRHGGMPADWLGAVVEPGIEETLGAFRSASPS